MLKCVELLEVVDSVLTILSPVREQIVGANLEKVSISDETLTVLVQNLSKLNSMLVSQL